MWKFLVKSENVHATQYPNKNDFFNAIMTYNYMNGALYTIYTAPLTITAMRTIARRSTRLR